MKVILYISILCIALFSCSSSQKSFDNLASTFSENDNYFINDYAVFNTNDSISELTLQINQNKLLYIKTPDNPIFSAHYEIAYRVYSSYSDEIIVDSTTFEFASNKENANAAFIHKIKFIAPKGKKYFLEIIARDLQRNSQFSIVTEVLKTMNSSRNYFSAAQNNITLKNTFVVDTGVPVFIQNEYLKNDTIYLKAYFRNFKLPLAPYDLSANEKFNSNPDSLILLYSDSLGSFSFTPWNRGFYFMQTDTSSKEGYTVFSFNETYPYIVKKNQLVAPLQYLCTSVEFKNISEATNIKKEVEKFWIESCGSKENASEHLKQYYLRTELANKFFSSYREGWRTDRGMIFIIFGAPKYILRGDNSERWVYGDDNSVMSEDFMFYRIDTPFSSNAYSLERSTLFKNSWFKMIEAWRDGRLF